MQIVVYDAEKQFILLDSSVDLQFLILWIFKYLVSTDQCIFVFLH